MARIINGKGFRNNIDIQPHTYGPVRRQEILDGITDKGTYLPKPVLEEDMDQSFVDFVGSEDGFSINIDGKKIPVIFLTIQRWTEFSKTWDISDKFKDIELPFVTIVRKPDIQQGQNQAGLWNIPGNRTYTYMKVPTWDGVRKGIDLYKVPQPTSVDLTYEVRIFTGKMKDLNRFNRKIQQAFQSRQCYINVNGHPMPLHLENIGDESNIEDFENRRFYVQMFEMKLLGYILDEEDYEIVPTANRTIMTIEVDEPKTIKNILVEPIIEGNVLTYNFVWYPNSGYATQFTALYNLTISQIIDKYGIGEITIYINNIRVFGPTTTTTLFTPLVIHADDVIRIIVTKNPQDLSGFKLIGNII